MPFSCVCTVAVLFDLISIIGLAFWLRLVMKMQKMQIGLNMCEVPFQLIPIQYIYLKIAI